MKITENAFVGAKPELVLKTVFGYDSFRLNQKEIISQVLNGHDTLAVMPTGGGKSICYQIPALIMDGMTVVVSPLISLMQDQVASLEASGIHSVFLNSSLEWEEYLSTVDDIRAGKVKIVYVSPEGLATSRIRELFCENSVKISLITIDEAHCVSQWGHDFRPDYMEISSVRNFFPDAVMLALTATATKQVQQDVIKNLRMKTPSVFISSFNRSNIFLEVQPKRNGAKQVVDFLKNHKGESGIIYCYSRKQVDELTAMLDKMGFSVLNYHAGLSDDVRAKNQDLFIKDKIQIMVATIAFGMGIDKPNVRFVINYDLPKSIEEYYQEIGRAGRDGLPSAALLLFSPGDIHKIRFFFEDSADPQKSEKLLQGMLSFASTRGCRRKALLGYFGELFEPPENESEQKCCCDICATGEIPMVDVTIPAQKLLSCILRTNERFGASYVIDVLLGSRQKRIIDNGHDLVSTWGIGKDIPKDDWFELLEQLMQNNYIYKEGDYNVLKVSYIGRTLLKTRAQIKLPIMLSNIENLQRKDKAAPDYVLHKKSEKISAEKPAENDVEAERIIEELKSWRRRKADDMNVPPYVVFNDKTLLDIAAKKPKVKADLRNVYGIGEAKAEQFGKAILRIVTNE
ncbi:MAG: DNA helicase RecQ [Treponema sp.]|nr:DNA helicase RecQ [Treponema sp.]